MQVHLVDGTYELFRHHFSPGGDHQTASGREVGATRGVLRSMTGLLADGATHIGIATDHVIESFRNDLWAGYKDGSGIDPALRSQFDLAEEVLAAAGFTVWPCVEVEADDALGAAATVAAGDPQVERVLICTPDKDLAQCVVDPLVVQFDRRANEVRDTAAVVSKFGVLPESIPDYLGLVGDSADGFPGLPGWGAKSAAAVLARYVHIEAIPPGADDWDVSVRGAGKLAATLREQYDLAMLFRRIATLELDVEVGLPSEWRWDGPTPGFDALAASIDASNTAERLQALAAVR